MSEIPSELVLFLRTEALPHSHTILKTPLGRGMAEIPCTVHSSQVLAGVVTNGNHMRLQGGNKMIGLLEEYSLPTLGVMVSSTMSPEVTTSRALSVTATHSQVPQGLQNPTTMGCSTSLQHHSRVIKGCHHKGTLPQVARGQLRIIMGNRQIMVGNSKILMGSRHDKVGNTKTLDSNQLLTVKHTVLKSTHKITVDSGRHMNKGQTMMGVVGKALINSKDLMANSKDMKDNTKILVPSSKDLMVNSKVFMASTKDMRASSKDLKANSRDTITNSRDTRASSRDLKANSKNMMANSRNMMASR